MATLTKQTVSKQKTSRLDIRLTDAQRQLIERAAELTGSTLTQWTARHLLESARKDIPSCIWNHRHSKISYRHWISRFHQQPKKTHGKGSAVGMIHHSQRPRKLGPEERMGEVLLWSTVHRQVGRTTRTVIGPAWDGRRVRVIHCVR